MTAALLDARRGSVVAPAGCGKTEQITVLAEHLARQEGRPPLVLTHTNAGVEALRLRLRRRGVPLNRVRLSTIDAWSIRLVSAFPQASALSGKEGLTAKKPNYREIHKAAARAVASGHLADVLLSSYSHVLVDEYQDCSISQHDLVVAIGEIHKILVFGDPLQAIFGFNDDPLPPWDAATLAFPTIHTLDTPHRWINAGVPELGHWLLAVRTDLLQRKPISFGSVPSSFTFTRLSEVREEASAQRYRACIDGLEPNESRLIVSNSRRVDVQQYIAGRLPGAVAVEAVSLNDVLNFSESWDPLAPGAFDRLIAYATASLLAAADGESQAAKVVRDHPQMETIRLAFAAAPSFLRAAAALEQVSSLSTVRTHRPSVLTLVIAMLRQTPPGGSLFESFVRHRDLLRKLVGDPPRLQVGSTLKLKGLEADTVVMLDGAVENHANLYVAITRGSKRVTVVSSKDQLP